jgi:hypothetical protein
MVAAALVAIDPTMALYSLRLKHFGVDALAAFACIVLLQRCAERPRLRRYAALAAGAAAWLPFSFTAIIPGVIATAIGGAIMWKPAHRSRRARTAAIAGGFLIVALSFAAVYAVQFRSERLMDFWDRQYLTAGDPGAPGGFPGGPSVRALAMALPPSLQFAWWLAAPGLVWLFVRRRTRPAAWLCCAAAVAAVAASALHAYPLGGGRTDIHLHPFMILAIAAAAGALERLIAPAAVLAAAALLGFIGFEALAGARYEYPRTGDRAIVEEVNALVAGDDGLIVYPWASWAVGLYGRWPIDLMPSDATTNGFHAAPRRDHSLVLEESAGGVDFRAGPEVVRSQLRAFLPAAPARIVVVYAEARQPVISWIEEALAEAGYRAVGRKFIDAAGYAVFERMSP